jgi:hypothetical protein
MAELDKARIEAQAQLAAELQSALLKDFKRLMDDNLMTAADRATLAKILRDNGWSFDISQLPEDLRSKLTSEVSTEDLEEDTDVIPMRRPA